MLHCSLTARTARIILINKLKMEETVVEIKITEKTYVAKNRRSKEQGRPTLRWMDEQNAKNMDATNWRTQPRDRKGWCKKFMEVEANK